MRWQEILLLSETNVDEVARKELAALFGMMKVKGIKNVPVEKVVSQITLNNMQVDPNDDASVNSIIDVITSLNNLVDKVEDGMVYLKYEDKPEYAPGTEKEKSDKKEIKRDATQKAKKNIKDKK